MEMIKTHLPTANPEAENKVEPLQMPEEPKGLELYEAEPKTEAGTKNRMAPSLTKGRGSRCHGYPAPPPSRPR